MAPIGLRPWRVLGWPVAWVEAELRRTSLDDVCDLRIFSRRAHTSCGESRGLGLPGGPSYAENGHPRLLHSLDCSLAERGFSIRPPIPSSSAHDWSLRGDFRAGWSLGSLTCSGGDCVGPVATAISAAGDRRRDSFSTDQSRGMVVSGRPSSVANPSWRHRRGGRSGNHQTNEEGLREEAFLRLLSQHQALLRRLRRTPKPASAPNRSSPPAGSGIGEGSPNVATVR